MTDRGALAPWSPRPVTEVFDALRPADRAPGEAAVFAAEMPMVLGRFELTDPEQARTELGHLTALMQASEDTAARLAERGFFKRTWARLTGDEAVDAQQVRARLGEVQARALAVVERLLTREAFLAHAAHHLGGRLELLAVENLKLKAALVALGERVVGRVERMESRVESLERRSDGLERRIALNELFQSGFSASRQRPYAEIEAPLERALTLARDFTEASGGDWRPIDLHRLRKLALGEAALADHAPLPLGEWVERALALSGRGPLAEWVRCGGLAERLMAPLDDETRSARSFYPVHFLLQRPRWFIEQGLPRQAATAVISDELTAYGLDLHEALTPWRLLQLLLEERLAWGLEAPDPTPALPPPPAVSGGGQTVGRTFPTGGRLPEALFVYGGAPLMRALDEAHGRPVLFEWVGGVARPVQPAPPIAELPASHGRWCVGDDALWILASDRRTVVVGRRAGDPGDPWSWQSMPTTTPGAPVGLAAGADRLLVWDRTTIVERLTDDRRNRVPRPVVGAAVGDGVAWLLLRDHVQRWPIDGEPLEWAPLPRGLRGTSMAVSPERGARPIVLCRDAERRAVLVAAGSAATSLPMADEGAFAPMSAAHVAVVSAGRLTVWSTGGGEPSAIEAAPAGVTGPLAADTAGRVAVFHPPSGAVLMLDQAAPTRTA